MRTIENLGLVSNSPQNLLSISPCGTETQGWNALAEIGRQLQILARAQSGKGDFFAPNFPPATNYLTVADLIELVILTKTKAEKSDRYLRELKYTLGDFRRRHGKKLIHEICHADVEGWLDKMPVGNRRKHGYLGDVRMLFNFAIKRGLLEKNPARAIELPEADEGDIIIHPPEAVRKVLHFALRYDLNISRALAIRYFAGLRTVETERAKEEHIHDTHIEVTAATSKRGRARRRRIVEIQPNLQAWLRLGGELPAPPQNGRRMLEFQRALLAAGIDWPQNVARHSFCSYHLAKFRNAGATALESGHTEEMLFGNYRSVKTPCGKLVTPALAEEYFSILPL